MSVEGGGGCTKSAEFVYILAGMIHSDIRPICVTSYSRSIFVARNRKESFFKFDASSNYVVPYL